MSAGGSDLVDAEAAVEDSTCGCLDAQFGGAETED